MQDIPLRDEISDTDSNLTKVSGRDIDVGLGGVKVIFCVRNEKFRLSYFLQYYRGLGVSEFFAVDNNSTDDTQSYLLAQEDVHVFHTTSSYKESNAGRDWTTELADRFCLGKWCLTLDVDEFLLFPDCENVDINLLTSYLDRWRYQGVFSIFLDFYSKKPLSQVDYKEGSSTFDLCDHFDSASSYATFETDNFPFFQIKGGIRQRTFWSAENPRSGPSMRKIVLVKWSENFSYLHSTHSCTPIALADISGVIAHFKFMSHFKEFSADEVRRNDRVQNSGDWKVYAEKLGEEDVVFYDPKYSVKFRGSKSLEQDGHFRSTLRYFDYCNQRFHDRSKDKDSLNSTRIKQREELRSDIHSSRILQYDQTVSHWSAISNFGVCEVGNRKSLSTVARLDEQIGRVMFSRQWKLTYPLRKLFYRVGMADRKVLIEDIDNSNIYVNFSRTYGSIWWDILAPIRIASKLSRRTWTLLKSAFSSAK